MASSGNINSGGYQGRVLQFSWGTNSTSADSNTRKIWYSVKAVGGSSSRYYHHNETVEINGTRVYTGSSSHQVNTDTVLASGELEINQNNGLNLTVKMHGGIYSYTDNINTEYTWTLDEIPRYANITSLSVVSRTLNSITLNVQTDRSARFYISTNGGANWLNKGNPFVENTTNANITISYSDVNSSTKLSPNTQYNFTVLSRATISGLDTAKGISATTHDIARLIDVPNINIGNSQNITWSNPSGAETKIKLAKTDNSQITDYGIVTGTNKTITPAATTIYALTPNSNTYTARYIITTTQNGVSYTSYKDFTFTVTNSNPTFNNYAYSDTNTTTTALTGNNQILIKGYSNVKVIVSAANKAVAKNSATMKSYKMTIGDKTTNEVTYSTSDISLTLNNINSNSIVVYAIDSRGNSTAVTKTLSESNYKTYTDLVIKSMSAERANSGAGQAVTLKYSGTFWNQSFGSKTNTISSVKYKYKKTTESSWSNEIEITPTISNNSFNGNVSIQGDLGANGFDINNSYNIQLIVSDSLSKKTYDIILGAGTPAIAIYKNKVAIGKAYDSSKGYGLQINSGFTCDDSLNTPLAGTSSATSFDQVGSFLKRNYMGSVNVGGTWYNLLNIRHRNGESDGVSFGMQIIKVLTNNTASIQTRSNYNGNWTGWEVVHRMRSLYDNSTGTNGTVTLSESVTNFGYIDIFYYKSDCGYQSVRVHNPNGKNINLVLTQLTESGGNQIFQALAKKIKISGTTITVNTNNSGYLNVVNAASLMVDPENIIYINKVIGYR